MDHSLQLTDWYISNYAMLNLACSCNYEDISKSLMAFPPYIRPFLYLYFQLP